MMSDMPDEIYLLHNEGDEGGHLWCDHIPNDDMDMSKYHHDRVVQALQAENKRLREALECIADARTCEILHPGFHKYKSHEDGWYGVIEFAQQALKESGGE